MPGWSAPPLGPGACASGPARVVLPVGGGISVTPTATEREPPPDERHRISGSLDGPQAWSAQPGRLSSALLRRMGLRPRGTAALVHPDVHMGRPGEAPTRRGLPSAHLLGRRRVGDIAARRCTSPRSGHLFRRRRPAHRLTEDTCDRRAGRERFPDSSTGAGLLWQGERADHRLPEHRFERPSRSR
jgi:hypothetical protein